MYRTDPRVVSACDDLGAAVRSYLDEYALDDGESVYHEPTDSERTLIEDAVHGLLADEAFVLSWNAWQKAIAESNG